MGINLDLPVCFGVSYLLDSNSETKLLTSSGNPAQPEMSGPRLGVIVGYRLQDLESGV